MAAVVTRFSRPLDSYARRLIDIFFDRRWPSLPVLHKNTFLEYHYEPLARGDPTDNLSSFQVYMVMAIASAETGPADSRHQFSHNDFFQIAIRDLHWVLKADDLDCIQSLLLLCMYGSNEPQSVNMWYTTGLALRLAIGIDLHRSETTLRLDLYHTEMAKRLFWSTYVMDRSMAIAMGRPLGVQDADITTALPLQLTDEQLSAQNDVPVADNKVPQSNDTSTFIHVIKLRRLNADIYKTLHAAGNSDVDQATLDCHQLAHYTKLNEWLATTPRYFPTASMFQTPEWFQIAYHQAVLSLYRPSHGAPVSSIDAIRICLDSSISLVSCYNSLYAKNKIVYTFVALNSVFMAAITMLYCIRASAAVRYELTKPVAEANIRSCLNILRGLSYGRAVGQRCAQIIERLHQAVFTVFDQLSDSGEQVDAEFLSWFGLKCRGVRRSFSNGLQGVVDASQPTPNFDVPWNDLIVSGFDIAGTNYMDMLF